MSSPVSEVPAADRASALTHFSDRLRFETDADDVAAALATGPDFVLIDARGPDAYEAGHLPGALSLPRPFGPEDLEALPEGLIVAYCWGPGCNGAVKTARRLAELGRPVKEMLGGFEYWVREGHPIEGADAEAIREAADRHGIVKTRGAISCLC